MTEPIEISFALENTIKPTIIFEDIQLLWSFTNEHGETFTNSVLFKTKASNEERSVIYNIVASTIIKAVQLNEHERKVLVIKLTPHFIGELRINAVVGKISVSNKPETKKRKKLFGNFLFSHFFLFYKKGNKRTIKFVGKINI